MFAQYSAYTVIQSSDFFFYLKQIFSDVHHYTHEKQVESQSGQVSNSHFSRHLVRNCLDLGLYSMGQFGYLKLSWKILLVNFWNCYTIFGLSEHGGRILFLPIWSERVGNAYLGSICVEQCCLVLVQGISRFQFISRLRQLVQRPQRPLGRIDYKPDFAHPTGDGPRPPAEVCSALAVTSNKIPS